MKKTVDQEVFTPAEYHVVYPGIRVDKFFGMDDDRFICIFQKIGQYCSQRMVTVRGVPVEIKMR